MRTIPRELFSLPLITDPDPIAEKLPRRLAEDFDIVSARLGAEGKVSSSQ